MIECKKCGGFLSYSYEHKEFTCGKCVDITKATPVNSKCSRCGADYIEYSWFDPSGCTECHKSFLD